MNMSTDHHQIPIHAPREDALGELVCIFSGLSPIFKRITSLDGSNEETCQALLHECRWYREQITAWYVYRSGEFGGLPTLASSELCPELSSGQHLSGTAYEFSSLDSARIHVLYWTILGSVENLIYQLSGHITTRVPESSAENEGYQPLIFYADEIARAMPYCLQDSMRIWSAHLMIFFAGLICKTYIDTNSLEKFIWSQQVLQRMADFGLESAARIRDVFSKLSLQRFQLARLSIEGNNPTGTTSSWWEYVKDTSRQ